MSVDVHLFEPDHDPRWDPFLELHPRAAVFHTSEWLQALRRTYRYEPIGFTTSAPGAELRNAMVFCRVRSGFTGHGLVSLPFSDHCDPLVETQEEFESLFSAVKRYLGTVGAKYVEIRPLAPRGIDSQSLLDRGSEFCFHHLDLRPSVEQLFAALHKDCVQRKVRRAVRERLTYEAGTSDSELSRFYGLLVATRRRQGLPPQPRAWFRNLAGSMAGKMRIRIASKDGRPVASILTLRYKDTLVYKYGCSDKRSSNLGGMQLLFWKMIEESKAEGLLQLDLGRSDWDNSGLIAFKDRWGARRAPLQYRVFGKVRSPFASVGRQAGLARRMVAYMPNAILPLVGSLLYRHLHRPPS